MSSALFPLAPSSIFSNIYKKEGIEHEWNFIGMMKLLDGLMGAINSLFRDEYEVPERLAAVLFVTGFVSAGFPAPLVGVSEHACRLYYIFS